MTAPEVADMPWLMIWADDPADLWQTAKHAIDAPDDFVITDVGPGTVAARERSANAKRQAAYRTRKGVTRNASGPVTRNAPAEDSTAAAPRALPGNGSARSYAVTGNGTPWAADESDNEAVTRNADESDARNAVTLEDARADVAPFTDEQRTTGRDGIAYVRAQLEAGGLEPYAHRGLRRRR